MKKFQVILTKSYIVKIKAQSEPEARRLEEFYTGDISDISTTQNKKEHNFEIKKITCGLNESFETNEVSG